MKFIYKKKFLKAFERYGEEDQRRIVTAEQCIRKYYETLDAPYGLRIKKLYDNGAEKTYEARASDKIRILWVEAKGGVVFAFIGSHDEVRRFIRSFGT